MPDPSYLFDGRVTEVARLKETAEMIDI